MRRYGVKRGANRSHLHEEGATPLQGCVENENGEWVEAVKVATQ